VEWYVLFVNFFIGFIHRSTKLKTACKCLTVPARLSFCEIGNRINFSTDFVNRIVILTHRDFISDQYFVESVRPIFERNKEKKMKDRKKKIEINIYIHTTHALSSKG
jgi:hypothetical protein